MQPLLDGPRRDLTERFVRDLLQSHRSIQIKYGAEALDSDFAAVGDISDYMSAGSTITCDSTATVHRTCSLNIDGDVTDSGWSYLSGFVRPYQRIIDVATGLYADFHLGVYTLTTPSRLVDSNPPTLTFAGYDLIYLLRQPVGDAYEVPAGSDPAQAAADVITLGIPEVEVIVTPSGSTLDQQMTWAFDPEQPVTYLQIVQELLKAIGYREVWVDWDGHFRVEPFIDMQEAEPEWVFDTDADDNIVAEDITQDVDLYNVPNWWRFVMADLKDTPVEGETMFTYEDNSPSNPGSTLNRGRTYKHIETVTVASYDDLVDYAQRSIVESLSPAEKFAANTQPFPLAWHLDVIRYKDESLASTLPGAPGGQRQVVSTGWTLPLDGQGDMGWTWQTITDQSATLGLTSSVVSE